MVFLIKYQLTRQSNGHVQLARFRFASHYSQQYLAAYCGVRKTIMEELNTLVEKDELEEIEVQGKSGFVHKEHRFILPLVLYAQRQGILPQPCDVICFDNHHDCCLPKNIDDLQKIDLERISMEDFIQLCDKDLSKLDDDWVIAGIELGLFSNFTVFGVTRNSSSVNHIVNHEYTDTKGIIHKVFIKSSHPGPMLDYQGDLCDFAKDHLKDFWKTINWGVVRGDGFKFKDNIAPFLLDIDLDCFCIYWSDFRLQSRLCSGFLRMGIF